MQMSWQINHRKKNIEICMQVQYGESMFNNYNMSEKKVKSDKYIFNCPMVERFLSAAN